MRTNIDNFLQKIDEIHFYQKSIFGMIDVWAFYTEGVRCLPKCQLFPYGTRFESDD